MANDTSTFSWNRNAAGIGYYLSVTVRNIGCFADADHTLDLRDSTGRPARVTILLGENGSGKTTLLRAIAGLNLVPFPAGSDSYQFRAQRWAADDLRNFPHRGGKRGLSTAITAKFTPDLLDGSGFSATCEPQKLFWTLEPDDLVPPHSFGYGASRRPGKASLSEEHVDDPAATLFRSDSDLISAEEWLLRTDYAEAKAQLAGTPSPGRLRAVREALVQVLPLVEDVRIDPEATGSTLKSPVEFRTPAGWFPLSMLGLGYQTLTTWIVDLARRMIDRYPNSNDPLSEPAVVLVDEIDLHLHPRWQRDLLSGLTRLFAKAQFIVTAHSPLIVQGAADANIAVLRREGDHVVIDNDAKAVRGWRVDQILTSDLFDLPTARPPEFDGKIIRRTEILSKPSLSPADETELAALDAEIGNLPSEPRDEDARRLLKLAEESAAVLRKYGG